MSNYDARVAGAKEQLTAAIMELSKDKPKIDGVRLVPGVRPERVSRGKPGASW